MSIADAYNIWADQYDTNHNKTRDLDFRATSEILKNHHSKMALELGCGTGKNTATLLRHSEAVVGLDFSSEMLKQAKQKFAGKNVEFKSADLNTAWPVANESFDLITANLVLEHIKDLSPIMTQAHQKLSAHGIFLISELHPFKQYTGSKARYELQGKTQELEVYTHHLSEYLTAGLNNGFKLVELKEWFDEGDTDLPRILTLVFQRQ